LKPILTLATLTLENTGEHFSDKPTERTMWNSGLIQFCYVNNVFHIHASIAVFISRAETLEFTESASFQWCSSHEFCNPLLSKTMTCGLAGASRHVSEPQKEVKPMTPVWCMPNMFRPNKGATVDAFEVGWIMAV
jgi:hypothetical protein